MEKKTFAFKLADDSTKGVRKWKARDDVALAGCSEVGTMGNWRSSFRHADDWYYC